MSTQTMSDYLSGVTGAQWLDFIRTVFTGGTMVVAFCAYRLAKDRWGFDKGEHKEKIEVDRRAKIAAIFESHTTVSADAKRLAHVTSSPEEFNLNLNQAFEAYSKIPGMIPPKLETMMNEFSAIAKHEFANLQRLKTIAKGTTKE